VADDRWVGGRSYPTFDTADQPNAAEHCGHQYKETAYDGHQYAETAYDGPACENGLRVRTHDENAK
jgi:hypothetical protein